MSLEANFSNELVLLALGNPKCCYEAAGDSFYISAKRIVGRQIRVGTRMRVATADNRLSCKCASGECDKAEAMVAAAKLGTDFRLSTSAVDTCGLARVCDFWRDMAKLPITTSVCFAFMMDPLRNSVPQADTTQRCQGVSALMK